MRFRTLAKLGYLASKDEEAEVLAEPEMRMKAVPEEMGPQRRTNLAQLIRYYHA